MQTQRQIILLTCIVALAVAAPQRSSKSRASERQFVESSTPSSSSKKTPVTPVPILRQINEILEDGSYRFGYEGGDGSFRIETRQPDGTVRGKYGFRDADGTIRVVDYSATNETGFDAQGEHIPKGPPPARGQPDDNNNNNNNNFDDDDEPLTTHRPRPRPRPRPTQRPSTPRPRPRTRPPTSRPPPPPPPPPQQHLFEDDIDDNSQSFFVPHQALSESSNRPRRPLIEDTIFTQDIPVFSPPPTTSRRPVFSPPPSRQPSLIRQRPSEQDFDSFSAEPPPRAETAVQQSSRGTFAAARPPAGDSFLPPRPRKPSRPPVLEDFLFPAAVSRRPAVTTRRPPPPPPAPLPTSSVDTDALDDIVIHQSSSRPQHQPSFSSFPRQRPPATTHRPSFQSQFRGSSSDGSIIDEFLSGLPQQSQRPRQRPPQSNRRPVFDDQFFNSDFEDRRHRQRMEDLSDVMGSSHGFILRADPASLNGNGRGRFEHAQLVKTVPGSSDPIFHTLSVF